MMIPGHRLIASLVLIAAVAVTGATLRGQSRTVAVTVDDAPRSGPPVDGAALDALNARLVAKLTARGVPAIAFVNEGKLYVDGTLDAARVAALARWPEAGLELGNHTFSHPSLSRISVEAFMADVVRGEPVTRRLLEERGMTLRYFRHPFLHVGTHLPDRRRFETWLSGRGYTIAPVTVENADYVYTIVYADALARGDHAVAGRVVEDYLEYTDAQFAFWERVTDRLAGRPIAQILLLHVNDLNADHFDAVAALLARRGYRFVSLDEALRDDIYARADSYVGEFGPVWPYRWGREANLDATWSDEPEPPAWVTEAFARIRSGR